jgi:hypothetical protein
VVSSDHYGDVPGVCFCTCVCISACLVPLYVLFAGSGSVMRMCMLRPASEARDHSTLPAVWCVCCVWCMVPATNVCVYAPGVLQPAAAGAGAGSGEPKTDGLFLGKLRVSYSDASTEVSDFVIESARNALNKFAKGNLKHFADVAKVRRANLCTLCVLGGGGHGCVRLDHHALFVVVTMLSGLRPGVRHV